MLRECNHMFREHVDAYLGFVSTAQKAGSHAPGSVITCSGSVIKRSGNMFTDTKVSIHTFPKPIYLPRKRLEAHHGFASNHGKRDGIASCINSYTAAKIVSRFGFDQ